MAFEDYVGKQFGNYKIIELVGKGGMAGVFRAHQPSMNRSVAVKIMAQQYSENETFVSRFKNEAQVIAQLEHAHILPVYDFGEEEGVLFIVMRFLGDGDLDDRIPDDGIPLEEAVPIFRQVAMALDYAHTRGIIHRDLKPSNVMIDAQGNAFLTDFGIAKSLEGTQNLTGTGGVVGTPTYMSPEQGMGDDIDSRSDIYALGVMLFEMLTGKVPFEADNPMAVMLMHINEPPPDPSETKPSIPRNVSNVVLRAMAKEPEQRFETAREMSNALEKALRGGQVAPPLTMPMDAAGPASAAATMPSPVVGAVQPDTSEGIAAPGAPVLDTRLPGQPQVTSASAPAPAAAVKPGHVDIELNPIGAWIAERTTLWRWVQGAALYVATFLLLLRLVTDAGLIEAALLSLVPFLLYSLLGAPYVGGLISMVLILFPLMAHTPALAILWIILLVVAGSRLNYIEIMLIPIVMVLAGTPLGWLLPLSLPWWLRARRSILPLALGVGYAMIFALMLGWPNAGGLLPVPADGNILTTAVFLSPMDTTLLGLIDIAPWTPLGNIEALRASIGQPFLAMGTYFAETNGLPLLIATAWAIAGTVSVSNRRVQSSILRGIGLLLGLAILMAAHLLPSHEGLVEPGAGTVLIGVGGAILGFLLTQFPIQINPNAGNQTGTVLRLLRQTMGAFFVAMGISYYIATYAATMPDAFVGQVLLLLSLLAMIAGTLVMITQPLLGASMAFAGLVGMFALRQEVVLTIVTAAMLFGYLIVNMIFDRRRPRRWNPIGAGLLLGGPGLSSLGLMPLAVVSLGTLEAQVPATILALLGHVLLITTAQPPFTSINIVVQLITTLGGVLAVERLMGSDFLELDGQIDDQAMRQKVRRLIFTLAIMLVLSILYYGPGGLEEGVGRAVFLAVLSAVWLVVAMGNRAIYWRQFVETDDEEEDIMEDEEVTGPWARGGG